MRTKTSTMRNLSLCESTTVPVRGARPKLVSHDQGVAQRALPKEYVRTQRSFRACFIWAGSRGSATMNDELTDTTSELDDLSFSADVKLNLIVTRGCVIHGFL